MTKYDQTQLSDLYDRVLTVLGSETVRLLFSTKPRQSAFSTALEKSIQFQGSPEKVTDEQIQGALQAALTVWPLEADISSQIFPQNEERYQQYSPDLEEMSQEERKAFLESKAYQDFSNLIDSKYQVKDGKLVKRDDAPDIEKKWKPSTQNTQSKENLYDLAGRSVSDKLNQDFIIHGTLIEGPDIDLIALSELDLTEEEVDCIWDQISASRLLVEDLECEAITIEEQDFGPGLSDSILEYHCGPREEFIARLAVALRKYLEAAEF